ncbi:MAG: SDR family NAD(P)-dependent oxidoreductase [Victivallis sp.]
MKERKKVALITGASQGLGACMAKRIAELGYLVIVNYAHSPERAGQVVEQIHSAGNRAVAMKCDISDEAAVKALFAELEEKFGGVDVLVNNARVDPLSRRPEETDGMWWDRVMAVGLRGAYLCSNEFTRYADRHRNGRIINVSSCRAHRPNELEAIAYSTSKLALHCLTRSYAAALAKYGITVNTLAPGMIATENMIKRIGRRGYETECGNIALHRAGTCDEIADGLIWAVENGFMTGETININGGQTYAP